VERFETVSADIWPKLARDRPRNHETGHWDALLDAVEDGQIVRVSLLREDGREVTRSILQAARFRNPQLKLDRRYSSDSVYIRKID
jgi:hypothetical protein